MRKQQNVTKTIKINSAGTHACGNCCFNFSGTHQSIGSELFQFEDCCSHGKICKIPLQDLQISMQEEGVNYIVEWLLLFPNIVGQKSPNLNPLNIWWKMNQMIMEILKMITDPFKKVDNSLSSSGMLFTGKEASERLLIRNSNDFFPFFISRVH